MYNVLRYFANRYFAFRYWTSGRPRPILTNLGVTVRSIGPGVLVLKLPEFSVSVIKTDPGVSVSKET